MHLLHKIEFLNKINTDSPPKKNAIVAEIEVSVFIERQLEKMGVVIKVILDENGAFDSAWWPAILKVLRVAMCLRNL